MKFITSLSSLRPFGWCFVLLLVSTQSWGQPTGCISGNCTNGQGTYTYANGNRYVGEFRDGLPNGQMTMTLPDGDQYVGEWRDGKFHGQGTYTFASGDQYVGEHKENKFNGQGTYTHANGNKYVGEFRDDKKHGQGTYTYFNNREEGAYVGEWRDDKRNGQGTLTYADGRVQAGIWEDDELAELAETDFLSELEESISLGEATLYVVYAEVCADLLWIEKADSEASVKVLEGMIDRGISEGRISRQEVDRVARLTEATIASDGFDPSLCQLIVMMTR